MKLILTGGGDSKHFTQIDKHFISLLGEKPKLLYIPLAQDEEDWENGELRIKEVFSTINFEDIVMMEKLDQLDWNELQQYKAIYFDGGNTFNLMDYIHHTHTYELLHRFLHNGGVINGDSAGAIVLGSHLETAHMGEDGDENEAQIISYQGLNLLGKWAIHCHYEDDHDDEIKEFTNNYGFPVLALYENSAAYIENKELKVIGENIVKIFNSKGVKSINIGDTIKLE